jgi:tetratricopeptide (TPR) repeat protein
MTAVPTPANDEFDVRALVDHADALNDRGAYADGLAAADDALAAAPEDGPAWTAKGWALENLGRPEEAEDAYRAAVRHDPGQPWAMVGLATVLEKSDRSPEAADLYRAVAERAEGRDRMGPDLLEIVGWSCFKIGSVEEAIALYRDALEIEPNRIAVRFDLALALLAAGDDAASLSEYRAGLAARVDPEALRAHVGVALEDLLASPWAAAGRAAEALLRPTVDPPAGDR